MRFTESNSGTRSANKPVRSVNQSSSFLVTRLLGYKLTNEQWDCRRSMAIFRSNAHVVWACLANTGIIKRLDLVLDPDLLLDLNYLHLDPDLPLDLNNRSKDVPVKPFLLSRSGKQWVCLPDLRHEKWVELWIGLFRVIPINCLLSLQSGRGKVKTSSEKKPKKTHNWHCIQLVIRGGFLDVDKQRNYDDNQNWLIATLSTLVSLSPTPTLRSASKTKQSAYSPLPPLFPLLGDQSEFCNWITLPSPQ